MHLFLWIGFGILAAVSLLGWVLVLSNMKSFQDFQRETFISVHVQEKLSNHSLTFLYSVGTIGILVLIFAYLLLRHGL